MIEAQLILRLRVAGGLIAAGLVVQLATIVKSSPATFLFFAFVGVGLVALGLLTYLLLVARQAPTIIPEEGAPTNSPAPAKTAPPGSADSNGAADLPS